MRLARQWWLLLATALVGLAALLLAGQVFGLFSSTTTNGGNSFSASSCFPAKVSMVNFAFSPATITVKRGCSVTWTNTVTTKHTSTSDTGLWSSGPMAQNDTFSYTFTSTGTFAYHCQNHAAVMTANVVVN